MSTTVSNPYSFNIVNNKNFSSPAIAIDLPSGDTSLNFTSISYCYYRTTIPNNVKVIKSGQGLYIGVTPNKTYNVNSASTMCIEGSGQSDSVYHNDVCWYNYSWGDDDGDTTEELDPNGLFYYSASINNHSVDRADY